MLYRLKGFISFTNSINRDSFIAEIETIKLFNIIIIDNCNITTELSNGYYIDIAFNNEQNIIELLNNIKTKNKLGIISIFIHIHKCRIEENENNIKGNISQYESYSYKSQ